MKITGSIATLTLSVFLLTSSCGDKNERLKEYKLARYKQVEKVEKQLFGVRRQVKLVKKSGLSNLIKNHYRKQLSKAYTQAKKNYQDDENVREKLQKIFEDTGQLYEGTANVFNESIQLGFAMETETSTRSFLNQLKNKNITVNGRVLNIKYAKDSNTMSMRVGFSKNILKTDKLVMVYFYANAKNINDFSKIRRYHDITLNLKVTKTTIREVDNFTIISITGDYKNSEIKGWLGLPTWADEKSLLPRPKKKISVKTSPSKKKSTKKGKTKKKKKTASKAASKKATTPVNTKPPEKKEKTDLQDEWNDEEDFD